MPLHIAQPPAEAIKAAAAGLARVRRLKPANLPLMSATPAADLALVAPHPVYTLTRDDVAEKRSPMTADQVRWRYLVMIGDRAVGGVEVEADRLSGEMRFVRADEGWIAGATAQAIQLSESRPEALADDFELRLLLVPDLYVVAVWLKDLGAGPRDDIFVPLEPAPRRFEPFGLYSNAAFMDLLRTAADDFPAFDSSPQLVVPAS